ncbi:MAG: hypothetical protein Q9227_005722 [Pyrenula ochraceoflavens]
MAAGLAQNFGTLLVCRFLAGTFASPALAVGAGTNSDVWSSYDRALASAILMLVPFFGPAIGPVVGGFSAEWKGWRWTQWTILMIMGAAYLFSLAQKETYKKIILKKRAERLNIPSPPQNLPTGLAKIKLFLLFTIGRPVVMLLTEPIVALLSLYTAFNFSVLFAFFAAFPMVFKNVYSFPV